MKSMVKTILVVLGITIVSKLLSLGSNQYYIRFYGINELMDAFSFALALPNIVFNSVGTSLTTIIIPIFAGYIAVKDHKKAYKFANNVIGVSVLITAVMVVAGIFLVPYLISLTGFNSAASSEFAIFASRMLLPAMFFYCLNFIFQGILQSLGKFGMAALISMPYSLTVILYVLFCGHKFGLNGLVIATLIGLSFQALILIPPLWRTDFKFSLSADFTDTDMKKAGKLMLPILLGTSAYQLNMLFNVTIAARYTDGATIVTIVQAIILNSVMSVVFSVTSVIFPKFANLYSTKNWDEFKNLLDKSIKTVLFFLVPVAVVFIALGTEFIDLIYGWGKFTDKNVIMAGTITALYAAGVLAHAVKEIVDRAFYAIQDTVRPAINGVIIMVVNIIASLIFIRFWGIYGVPTAYTVSLIVGAIVIVIMLGRKLGIRVLNGMMKFSVQSFISGMVMTIAIWGVKSILSNVSLQSKLVEKSVNLFVPAIISGIVFIIVARIIKMKEVEPVFDKAKAIIRKMKH